MAYSMDPGLLRELIRIGRPPVSERGVRSAEKTVSPLSRWLTLPRERVLEALAACFLTRYPARFGTLDGEELTAAHRLAVEKYRKPEWIDRIG